MTNEKMMREAPVWKLLCGMSLPVIVVMLLQVLYNMADVFFMGRTGATMQVAAISLAGPVFTVIAAFNTLLGFGGCTAISVALGRGESRKVRQYSAFVLYGGLLAGLVIGAAILAGLKPLLGLLGANAETEAFTADYLRVLALGAPFSIAGGALGNSIRADGDSKGALLASMLGIFVNMALDPLFISVFGWGIRGAAIATVAGNTLSFAALLIVSYRKKIFSVSVRDLTFRPEISIKVLSCGLPMAAGTLLTSFVGVFGNRLMVNYGNLAVAAQNVAGKAGMITSMVIMGICMGIQPAVSYNHGAGNARRVRRIVFGVGGFSVLLGAALSVVLYLARQQMIGLFISDPQVTELALRMMPASLLGAPLYGVYQMASVYLQGTEKVSRATLTSLLRQGLVLVPVMFLMNGLFGLTGLIYAGPVADLIATALAVILCVAGFRGERRLGYGASGLAKIAAE